MNPKDDLPDLSEPDSTIFRLFCEKAIDLNDPLAPATFDDLPVEDQHDERVRAEFAGGVERLMEQGYLYRAGRLRYVITQAGFQNYALAHIEEYDRIENAVKDAVVAVDTTDTRALVAATGEKKYLVNHILRLLQNQRDIGAFAAATDSIHVTRVSGRFKQQQTLRRLAGSDRPAATADNVPIVQKEIGV